MPIEFACSSCRQTVRVADAAAGKKGKCPKCGTILDIPLASPAAPAASPAAPARPKSAAASAPQPVSNPAAKPAAQGAPKPTAKVSGNNVSFPCPSCAKPIVAPAALTGKKGKCPHCQAKVVIGGVSPPETDGLQPLGPDDLAPLGPGDLAPLGGGTGDLFADLPPLGGPANSPFGGQPLPNTPPLNPLGAAPSPLGTAYGAPSPYGGPAPSTNPYASPSPYGGSPYGGSPYGGAGHSGGAPAKLMIPAIGLIVISTLTILGMLFQSVMLVLNATQMPAFQRAQGPEAQGAIAGYLIGSVVGIILGLIVNGVVIAGAVKMIRLQSWDTAKSAATLAIVPCCSLLCLNMPLGIWALIVLNQPDVKRLFRD
ncbi:MAG: hypothetical protein MUF06_21080 [Pirellulaceae bacterium]|nr:hypothetical protein [Pirellulaceae bacterium]